MNEDNSKKATAGSKANKAMKAQLEYLLSVGILTEYSARKFGYSDKKENQFKCDYLLTLKNGEKWIIYVAASLSTDRLKTKQWDSFHIKKIDKSIRKAYIVCPDVIKKRKSLKAYKDICRYDRYIKDKEWVSSIDGIMLQSELVDMLENLNLGIKDAGTKAAKKGLNFEVQLKGIVSNKQNLDRWKGDDLAAGWHYDVFQKIVDKLELNPDAVLEIKGDTGIEDLPTYTYKDGSTKRGGHPKTDLLLTVVFLDRTTKEFTISCKSSTKKTVSVHQFPPKYGVEILDMKENDSQQLLEDYVASGGPKNFMKQDSGKAKLLAQRLSDYRDELSVWALKGTEKDGSSARQRAEYIVTRFKPKRADKEEYISIETVNECMERQRMLGKGHFGTDFSWTVTSTDKKGEIFPSLQIHIDAGE